MKYLKGFDTALSRVEGLFIIISLTTMIGISFVQVILRNFFSTGLIWADELTRHLVLWVGFIAASLATREDRHINIDILSRTLTGRRSKLGVQAIINLAAFSISFLLLRAAWHFVSVEKEFGDKVITLSLPVWGLEIIFPITFILISFRFGLRAVENIFRLASASKA
jgi:TRAP-type C4-dicarboxylate transport system permease small subunit